jgi:hypothetical protein
VASGNAAVLVPEQVVASVSRRIQLVIAGLDPAIQLLLWKKASRQDGCPDQVRA